MSCPTCGEPTKRFVSLPHGIAWCETCGTVHYAGKGGTAFVPRIAAVLRRLGGQEHGKLTLSGFSFIDEDIRWTCEALASEYRASTPFAALAGCWKPEKLA